MTVAERHLWRGLREALPAHHWRKQVPLGRYIVDFCSHSDRLIIEVDGGQHAEAVAHDTARTAFLQSEGYRVLRFWNNDVLDNIVGVLKTIASSLSSPLVGEDQGGGRESLGSPAKTLAFASPGVRPNA